MLLPYAVTISMSPFHTTEGAKSPGVTVGRGLRGGTTTVLTGVSGASVKPGVVGEGELDAGAVSPPLVWFPPLVWLPQPRIKATPERAAVRNNNGLVLMILGLETAAFGSLGRSTGRNRP
jgi:hypothetical protein